MLTQIAHALAVMHEHCYQHLDVKPENALLDDDDNADISDFGLSRLRHRPPEALPRDLATLLQALQATSVQKSRVRA